MKQIEKLCIFIKNPTIYGVRKNTRVYKYICELVCEGIAQTGYSDKNTKFVEIGNVVHILDLLGVSCGANNVAPRGGACGERVFLTGKVKKDCLENFKKFVDAFLHQNSKKYSWDAKYAFIASLQK